jgi:hypothetical protein
MTPLFESIAPLIPAGPVLEDALELYARMGFSLDWRSDTMAGIRQGNVKVNLVQNDSREWASNASFSIAVNGLEALFRDYRNAGFDVGPLERKSWGRMEFHVIVPPGVCFQFYEFSTET